MEPIYRISAFDTKFDTASFNCGQPPLDEYIRRYAVPVALIGRLAVPTDYQGKVLGSILLADACRKVINASATLAVAGIVVDAKDSKAASFYQHFGFVPLPGQADRLLLPITAFRT